MAENVIEVRKVDKFYGTGSLRTQVLFGIDLGFEDGR